MIQALSGMPYSSSKTDEIMSRYRPIAPKPEVPSNGGGSGDGSGCGGAGEGEGGLVPEKFRQSPYLRNIWSHLQARPTRTRKRGRSSGISPAMLRKQQNERQSFAVSGCGPGYLGFPSSFSNFPPSHARNLSFHAFGFGMHGGGGGGGSGDYNLHARYRGDNNININNIINYNDNHVVELPLLSCPPLLSKEMKNKTNEIDLNKADEEIMDALDAKDYLSLQLQITSNDHDIVTTNNNNNNNVIISPRPVRPVGSTISIVGPIGEDPAAVPVPKSAETVEAEAEVEALPAFVSDRGNKVRVVNSAYKELVGQPECPWLDTMVSSLGSKRISGNVVINSDVAGIGSRSGFNSWVRIEWESSEGRKKSVNAFCEVVRLVCESKDYDLYWRFHTRELSPSASKV